jgi:putative ABC transport system permease protein
MRALKQKSGRPSAVERLIPHAVRPEFRDVFDEIAAARGRSAAWRWFWGQTFRSLPGFISNRLYWSLSMLRNYGVIAFRNLAKNKGFSLINLTGLAVGLAGVILIAAYVRFETSYDRFHEKADCIARVLNTAGKGSNDKPEYFGSWFDSRLPGLLAEVPEIARVTKTVETFADRVVLRNDESAFVQSGFFVDDQFLQLFSFPLLRGDRETVFKAAGAVVLTDRTARKFFGSEDPVGKPLHLKSRSVNYDLTVAGVAADVPPNSQLQFDFLISQETFRHDPALDWIQSSVVFDFYTTYVELRRPEDRTVAEAKLKEVLKKSATPEETLNPALQPFTDVHLRSRLRGRSEGNNEIRVVRLFSAVAAALLLIAAVNYVNLSTSRAAARAKEVGVRKVIGAGRSQLVLQFLGESLVMAGLSVVLALAMVRIVWPMFKNLTGIGLEFRTLWSPGFLALLLGTGAAAGLLSGIYPAFYLSRLRPVQSLRELSRAGRKGGLLRSGLVVLQFGAALILLVGTFVIGRQMDFVRNRTLDTGRETVAVVPIREEGTLRAAAVLRADFLNNPDVAGVSLASFVPPKPPRIGRFGVNLAKDDGTKSQSICAVDSVDENFLAIFNIELLQGRNIRPGEKGVALVNETFVREVGWKNPLGKILDFGGSFKTAAVIGILKDFHFMSLHTKIAPLALIPGIFPPDSLSVRIKPGNVSGILAGLKRDFERRNRDQPFEYRFLDDVFNAAYAREIRSGRFLRIFSLLAVFVACLGLSGLTAYAIERRMREIGIRKILGASALRLTMFLNAKFLALVFLAHLFALPAACWAMNNWLRGFAYRAGLSFWTCAAASGIVLFVALTTISLQTSKAALRNPADTLRRE